MVDEMTANWTNGNRSDVAEWIRSTAGTSEIKEFCEWLIQNHGAKGVSWLVILLSGMAAE